MQPTVGDVVQSFRRAFLALQSLQPQASTGLSLSWGLHSIEVEFQTPGSTCVLLQLSRPLRSELSDMHRRRRRYPFSTPTVSIRTRPVMQSSSENTAASLRLRRRSSSFADLIHTSQVMLPYFVQ
jgi:hypothetical protein